MGPKALFSSILSLVFLATLASASTFLSDDVFGGSDIVKNEALKACTIDFTKLNYTDLTRECKGPNYSPEDCCKALKQFACPFANYINDLSTDCAYTMFYNINLNVHYPIGLLYNKCIQGPKGLDCSSGKQ